MTKEELFKIRGRLTFEISLAQAKLQQIDQQLLEFYKEEQKING